MPFTLTSKPMTYLRRNFAQCTAGNFETEHAQYDRRGNAPKLNDPRPLHGSFELGGLAPVDFTLRRRSLQASAL